MRSARAARRPLVESVELPDVEPEALGSVLVLLEDELLLGAVLDDVLGEVDEPEAPMLDELLGVLDELVLGEVLELGVVVLEVLELGVVDEPEAPMVLDERSVLEPVVLLGVLLELMPEPAAPPPVLGAVELLLPLVPVPLPPAVALLSLLPELDEPDCAEA